jgi:hypothetical protein
MRNVVTSLLILCVLTQPLTLAAEPSSGTSAASIARDTSPPSQIPTLREAIDREAMRLALSLGGAGRSLQRPDSLDRGWIRRHPALFGALVGAGAGAATSIPRWTELYCSTGGDEDCLFHGGQGALFGAAVGAGIGALIGFLVGHGTK